ncbi:hypothetical protein J8273_5533 [Carpediemonas membranifera]|uniref:Uncharacterized protein n=1 Tax=Carpediemonas membranifera TaxID=201153 RepID=A0A8J6E0Q7_9EUKA|nr:hypothetical protein J8273_5533 [Carpediemonas membranifera]|eukprot:KAG9392528.1 hypothetical protein J8273_5533 [Carpediemonas membranifera]
MERYVDSFQDARDDGNIKLIERDRLKKLLEAYHRVVHLEARIKVLESDNDDSIRTRAQLKTELRERDSEIARLKARKPPSSPIRVRTPERVTPNRGRSDDWMIEIQSAIDDLDTILSPFGRPTRQFEMAVDHLSEMVAPLSEEDIAKQRETWYPYPPDADDVDRLVIEVLRSIDCPVKMYCEKMTPVSDKVKWSSYMVDRPLRLLVKTGKHNLPRVVVMLGANSAVDFKMYMEDLYRPVINRGRDDNTYISPTHARLR